MQQQQDKSSDNIKDHSNSDNSYIRSKLQRPHTNISKYSNSSNSNISDDNKSKKSSTTNTKAATAVVKTVTLVMTAKVGTIAAQ